MNHELVLEMKGVSRQFGAVRALTDVSFECRAGEIHALVGENGSGKSTLLGIASGFVDPDLGDIRIGGKPPQARLSCAGQKARPRHGIPGRLVDSRRACKNNLYYAAPPDQRPAFWRRKKWARRVLAEFDLDLELFPDAPAGFSHPGRTTTVRGRKGACHQPQGAAPRRADDRPRPRRGRGSASHRVACRDRGVGVVYVSHRLPEVLEVADRITVLRDGPTRAPSTRGRRASRSWSRNRRPPLRGCLPGSCHPADENVEVLVVDGLQGQSFGPVSFTLHRGRSLESPVPKATASRSSSTASQEEFPLGRERLCATARI